MKKRALSIFLSLALVLTLLPTAALATSPASSYTSETDITLHAGQLPEKMKKWKYWGDGTFCEESGDTYTFYDMTGNKLGSYEGGFGYFSEGLAVVSAFDPYTANTLRGYIDKTGAVVIPIQFETAGDFHDGVAEVTDSSGNSFYIDTTGAAVADGIFDGRYSDISEFSDGVALATIKTTYNPADALYYEHRAFIDKQGNVVYEFPQEETEYSQMDSETLTETTVKTMRDTVSPVTRYENGGVVVMNSSGKYYLMDKTGAMRPMADPGKDYRISGYLGYDRLLISAQAFTYYAVIDLDGNIIIPFHSNLEINYEFRFDHGLGYISEGPDSSFEYTHILIDTNGKEVLRAKRPDPFVDKLEGNTFSFYALQDGFTLGEDARPGTYGWEYVPYIFWVDDCPYAAEIEKLVSGSSGSSTGSTDPTPSQQPSSWAKADVDRAIAANILPAELRGAYGQATTRREFCLLADALYTAVKGSAAPQTATFTDTTDPAVLRMASVGVVNGVGNGAFNPNGQLTREQAATLLARLAAALGKPLAESAPTFADSGSVSSWAKAAVGQMQKSGIMGGVGNNLFSPAGSYTREQSTVTIMRLYDLMK